MKLVRNLIDRFIVFDTETPNYRNDRMCSIGVCLVENGEIAEEYYTLIDPECGFSDLNIGIHGIRPEMVDGAPTFPQVWGKLRRLFSSGLLVAHNAQFDMSVLSKCLRDYSIPWRDSAYYACTCQMSRICMPQTADHKLDTLCRYLNIQLDHHNAISDSRACAMILLHCLRTGIPAERFIRTYDMARSKTVKARAR